MYVANPTPPLPNSSKITHLFVDNIYQIGITLINSNVEIFHTIPLRPKNRVSTFKGIKK